MSGLIFDEQESIPGLQNCCDFTCFLQHFSQPSLVALCDDLRHTRTFYAMTPRTFKDNHLLPAYRYLEAYTRRVAKNKKSTDWIWFAKYAEDDVVNADLAETTRKKKLRCLQIFIQMLHRIGWVDEIPLIKSLGVNSKVPGVGSELRLRRAVEDPYQTELKFRVPGLDRPFNFAGFEVLGLEFIGEVIDCFKRFHVSSGGMAVARALRNFLTYLVEEKHRGYRMELFEALSRKPTSLTVDEWIPVLLAWRETVTDSKIQPVTMNQHIRSLNRFWRNLAKAGLVPDYTLKGVKNCRRKGASKRRKTLMELGAQSETKFDNAAEKLVTKIEANLSPEEKSEAKEAVRALVGNIDYARCKNFSVEELMHELYDLNSVRLSDLRIVAQSEFDFWYSRWEVGQQLISEAKRRFKPGEITHFLDGEDIPRYHRRRNSGRYLNNGADRERLANFLLYLVEAHGGHVFGRFGRIHHVCRSFEDAPGVRVPGQDMKSSIQSYLTHHDLASAALWILLLVDTAANCEVCRNCSIDLIRKAAGKHEVVLALGEKLRAGAKLIYDTHDKNSSLVVSIEKYLEMSRSLRENYPFEPLSDANKLLIYLSTHKRAARAVPEYHARNWFRAIAEKSGMLKGIDVLPSHIRASVLLEAHHRNESEVLLVQALADHESAQQTDVYTGRVPVRIEYNAKIRAFQERYQAVLIASISDAPSKLGLSDNEFKDILTDSFRTGLGVVCLDAFAGAQPGVEIGKPCLKVENCCECRMSWVVATKENIADLILFQNHLERSEEETIALNPKRWESVWLPWKIFCDVAIGKLKKGETAKIFLEGMSLAGSRQSRYAGIPLI